MLYFFLQFGIHQPKSQPAWKHSELLLEKKQLVLAFTAATCLSLKAIVILQALAVFVKQGSQTAREVRGKDLFLGYSIDSRSKPQSVH